MQTFIKCLLLAVLVQNALAAYFGDASNLNLYTIQDFSQTTASSAGAIGVGGTATIQSSFTVANNNGLTSYALVVKKDLRVIVGSLLVSNGGSVLVGGSETGSVYFNAGGSLSTHVSSLPIDFTATSAYLVFASAYWASLPVNGLTTFVNGNTLFHCVGAATLQVFNMAGSYFSSAGSFTFGFVGCTASTTIIVLVSGTTITITNGQANFGVVSQQRVIFNFYEATSISISASSMPATILAPKASITGGQNAVVCQVFCNSMSGSHGFEYHSYEGGIPCWFSGTLPPPSTPAPTPAPTP